MSFTLETKLHILLIMTVVGIALYMYLLYKEIRLFQEDINIMKAQIFQIQNALPSKKEYLVKESEVEDKNVIVDNVNNDDDEDNDSVTSNEIKKILTNIHDEDEDEDEGEQVKVEESVQPVVDIHLQTAEQLSQMECKDLRKHLQELKLSTKGTKAELVKRIISVQQSMDNEK
jgi:hypothetical protein